MLLMQVQMQVADAYQTVFVQWQPADKNHMGEEVLDIVTIDRDDVWFTQHKAQLYSFYQEVMKGRASYVAPGTKINKRMYNDL
jgi:hypothetical protein